MTWIHILSIIAGVLYGIFSSHLKRYFLRMIEKITQWLTKLFPPLKRYFLWSVIFFAEVAFVLTFVRTQIARLLTRSLFGIITASIILVIIYSFIWYYTGFINDPTQDFLTSLYEFMGYTEPDEYISIGIFNIGTKVLMFQLTATLTLFYFIYREQRSASISSIRINSNTIVVFIIFTVITMFLGVHLGSSINRDILQSSRINEKFVADLAISSDQVGRIITWGILFLSSVLIGIRTVIHLVLNLSIRNMLSDIIHYIRSELFILRFIHLSSQRKYIYSNLFSSVESLQQLMSMGIDKGMDEAYASCRKEWDKLLADLLQSPRFNSLDNTVISEYLLNQDEDKFEALYNLILKNQTALIMVLVKNHKIEEALNGIKLFLSLNPSQVKLRFGYLNALQELAMLMYSNDSIGLEPIFEGLEKLAIEDGGDHNGINIIYKCLINKAIIKNDVKMLSSISYSMSKASGFYENNNLKIDSNIRLLQMKNNISIGLKESSKDTLMHCIIYIFLQATLKSIELSHYACTGFLIKFLVTSFKSHLLNESFFAFTKNEGENNPYLKQREVFSKINVSFNFNQKTSDYCHKKLTILLYAQQKYVVDRKIDFGEVPKSFIDISHVNCNYVDYLFEKIDAAKSKYGLLFLDDKNDKESGNNFLGRIKEEVKKKKN